MADLNETNGSGLVVTAVLFLVISYLSVLLRTYVRAVLTHGFQGDDWLMLVAQVNYTLSCSFILAGVNAGVGHHNKALSQAQEIEALKWQALATATYISNMMFIKLSIGIFLLRLATQKRYRYTIWGAIGVIAIMSTVLFFWNLFQCSPLQAQWDYTIPGLKCVSTEQVVNAAYALSIMTILSDWFFALLPIPMIWSVKMSTQAKLTVSVVLGLGVFASVATLIRLKFLADLNDAADILFAGTDAMIWTLVEPGVAISAASLVTIRPLLRAWRLKGFESTDRYGSRKYGMRSGGTGSGTGAKGRLRISRGMPGFGSEDYANGVELGTGTFSSTPTTTGTNGALASGGPGATFNNNNNNNNNNTPTADAIRRPDSVKPINRMSEGTAGTESRASGQIRRIDTPATNSAAANNPFDTVGPLPNGPLNSNPSLKKLPLPASPELQGGLVPPSRRTTMNSEMFIIEGERVRPMSRNDLAWVARHQHSGWEDRHAEEASDGPVNSSTDSVDTVSWIQAQGQRVGGGSMNTPVERSGVRARDGAYGLI